MTYVFLSLILILTFVQTYLIYLGINAVISFIICSAYLVYCTFQFISLLISLPFTPRIAWKQEHLGLTFLSVDPSILPSME